MEKNSSAAKTANSLLNLETNGGYLRQFSMEEVKQALLLLALVENGATWPPNMLASDALDCFKIQSSLSLKNGVAALAIFHVAEANAS